MKAFLALSLFILSTAIAGAQSFTFNDAAAPWFARFIPQGDTFNTYPTNLTNITCVGWWVFDDAIMDGTQITNVPGRVTDTKFEKEDLTFAPQSNNVNGHIVGEFDGTDDYMTAPGLLSGLPLEVVIVGSLYNDPTYNYTASCLFGFGDGVASWVRNDTGGGGYNLDIENGSALTCTTDLGTGWMIFDSVFDNGTSSQYYTNKTLVATGDAGVSADLSGTDVYLASRFASSDYIPVKILEIYILNGVMNAYQRSNQFYRVTNTYGIAP